MLCFGQKLMKRNLLLVFGVLLLFLSASISQAQNIPVSLADEEKKWLADHPTLRLGVGVAYPPYMWVDEQGGSQVFKGIVSDYIDLLAKRLGVTMQVEFGIPFNEALKRGREGQIDFFPCLSETPERSAFLSFTKPYLNYPMVIITREDAPLIGGVEDLAGKRLAVVKHLVAFSKMQNDYPDIKVNHVFNTRPEENLEAVSFNRADACIINLAVATYYIQRKGLTNLRIAAPLDWQGVQLSMAVRKDWPLLRNIIEKGMASISQEEKDRISQRWIRVKYEPGVETGLVWRWSLGVGGSVVMLFAVVLVWNRRLQREISGRIHAEEEREKVISKLQAALDEVKTLQGFIPICANCKNIRDDEGYWKQIEQYVQDHSYAKFSHGICPECVEKLYPGLDITGN